MNLKLTENLCFGEAVRAMKEGYKVQRKGWNGVGMFAYLVDGGKYKVQMPAVMDIADENGCVEYSKYMALKKVDGTISPWAPSGSDALAEDWVIL